MVNIDNQADFPALAKRVKEAVNGDTIGDAITGMRKTRGGALLLEIRGDHTVADTVKLEVARAAGGDADVRVLQQKCLVEVRDIDAWSDRSDISDSISKATGLPKDNVQVVGLRTMWDRSQTALTLLPLKDARGLIDKGRVKIGLVSCRVRLAEKKGRRCFRCLAFDHESKDCKGTDRSKCCRRCGGTGHYARECNTDADAAAAFGKTLREESRKAKETGAELLPPQ